MLGLELLLDVLLCLQDLMQEISGLYGFQVRAEGILVKKVNLTGLGSLFHCIFLRIFLFDVANLI